MICPCEVSNKPLRDCCLFMGQFFRKLPPDLSPKLPKTNYALKDCYLNPTLNCSTDISAEHYHSKTILEALGKTVAIDGAPWLPKGESREIGINNVKSKILCSRHNSNLSDLDSEAGRFFRKLKEVQEGFLEKSISIKRKITFFSGEALELWMLKTACGMFYSENASQGSTKLFEEYTIDKQIIIKAFFEGIWQSNDCGLYVMASVGHKFNTPNSVRMAPLTTTTTKRFAGYRIELRGLDFMILFDARDIDMNQINREGWLHKPTEICFTAQKRSHSMALTWLPGQPEKCLTIKATPIPIISLPS